MKRYVTLEEISDGRLYKADDLAKTDCLGCEGCSRCCTGMGESVILDPYDIWRLHAGLNKILQELLEEKVVALGVVDSVILPHLVMTGKEERCSFLNEQGRCSIHEHRPGICRLFPLGRYYEDGRFHYILQTGECSHPKAKIRISKWLDTPQLQEYEAYILEWHGVLKQAQELQMEDGTEEFGKNLNLFILRNFFLTPYAPEKDFYQQFQERMIRYREIVTSV